VYYLGTITGASGAYSNQQTGASGIGTFFIPPAVRALYLMASASGVLFELGASTGVTGAIGSTFQTTAARGAQLDGPNTIMGPFRCVSTPNQSTVVSIFNSAGGFVSVRVYAAPTS
jgi:hypothetical protein